MLSITPLGAQKKTTATNRPNAKRLPPEIEMEKKEEEKSEMEETDPFRGLQHESKRFISHFTSLGKFNIYII